MPRTFATRRACASGTAAAVAAAAVLGLTTCGESNNSSRPPRAAVNLNLGYFANVTHAPAVIGVADGSYARALGPVRLTTTIYTSGPTAVQALLSGAVDAAYIGPSPAINAYVRSGGQAVRVVAGGVSGGTALVVRPSITSAGQLAGRTVADPQRGGTQDVALKYFLKQHALDFTNGGPGSVDVVSQSSAQTLTLFRQGRIDGAWLPEPWVSRLQQQAGAKILVDERTQWPGGDFTTTNLVVSDSYLRKHPQTVSALLKAQVATTRSIRADPAAAARTLRADLRDLTGKALPASVVTSALRNVNVGWDPYAASLKIVAAHAVEVGLLEKDADLSGIYDLRPLNAVLRAQQLPAVSDGGLGVEEGSS
ncbi:MAG: ABC transporter substrate-binding protein [Allobranchiibius sp.]